MTPKSVTELFTGTSASFTFLKLSIYKTFENLDNELNSLDNLYSFPLILQSRFENF